MQAIHVLYFPQGYWGFRCFDVAIFEKEKLTLNKSCVWLPKSDNPGSFIDVEEMYDCSRKKPRMRSTNHWTFVINKRPKLLLVFVFCFYEKQGSVVLFTNTLVCISSICSKNTPSRDDLSFALSLYVCLIISSFYLYVFFV